MNLFIKKEMISGKQKNVVFGIYNESGANVTAYQLIMSRELFDYYSRECNLKISAIGNLPVVITTDSPLAIACTNVYSSVKQTLEKPGIDKRKAVDLFIKRVTEMLKDAKKATTLVKFIIEDMQATKTLTLAKLDSFNLDQIDADVRQVILNEYSSRESSHITETLFQKTCTDKLSLRLPTATQLSNEDIELGDLIPKRSEVCNPYNNPMAYTSLYKQPGSGITAAMYPLIEGNPKNNTLGIQENEKDFYENLVEWIRSNISNSLGPEALNADDKNIVLDSNTAQYLNELYAIVYSWHWSHNPNVPSYSPESEDDDEFSDSNDSNGSQFVYTLRPGEEFDVRVPAFLPLQNFIQQAALELGYKVYAEAVIKLCRWGERKPSALYFEGFPYIFDLGKNVTEVYAGHISDYVQSEDENGCNMILKGLISCNSRIIDTKYMVSHGYKYNSFTVPVGLIFTQIYTNKKNPEKKIKLDSYYSMIDVVKGLFAWKKGKDTAFRPRGFSIDENGVIHTPIKPTTVENISSLRQKYHNERATSVANPFYCSPALQDLFIELKVYDSTKEINQFYIIDNGVQTANLPMVFDENSFSTIEELAAKFADCTISSQDTAIDMSVFRILLPILLDVNKKLAVKDDVTLPEIVNTYKEAMLQNNYVDEAAFYKKRKQEGESFSSLSGLRAPAVEADTLESTVNTGTTSEHKEQADRQSAIAVSPTAEVGAHVNPLVTDPGNLRTVCAIRRGAPENVIGYYVVRRVVSNGMVRNEVVLLNKDYVDRHPEVEVKNGGQFRTIVAGLLEALRMLCSNKRPIITLVESEECLDYYVKLYIKIVHSGQVV